MVIRSATIAYYGPDDVRASKVSVGIILDEGNEVAFLERWFDDEKDVRRNSLVNEEIIRFLTKHGVKSIVMPDRILGCPHEEGIDHPDGLKCPQCSFWSIRDRFTGQVVQ